MKKIILSLILLILSITLISCGLTEQEKMKVELYDKYKDLISALESKDNAAATQELLKITQSNSSGQSTTEPEDEFATAEKWMKEIVGTWHEMYGMYDDITFRDDATCTYDGNTYSVEFDSKSGSVINFNLKSEEKVIYIVELYSDYADNDTSSDLFLWEIVRENTKSQRGLYICSADYNAQKDEWMDKIFGTWYDMDGIFDITFREDGTCAYNGKTYTVEYNSDRIDSTGIYFNLIYGETATHLVKLERNYADNGTSSDITLWTVVNNGYRSDGYYLCAADYNAQSAEWMDKLVGDWINDSTRITVNNDGTCIIDGTTYTVRFRVGSSTDSTVYFKLYNGNTEEYKLGLAKDFESNGVNADITLQRPNPHYGAGAYFAGTFFCRASDYEAIELTVDNWLDYFEIVDVIKFEENPFGEAEKFTYSRYYCLKDEYVDVTAQYLSNIAIEYTRNRDEISCVVDPTNRTVTLGEKVRDINAVTETDKMQYYDHSETKNRIGFEINYNSIGQNGFKNCTIYYTTDVVMNRIKGTLYILK